MEPHPAQRMLAAWSVASAEGPAAAATATAAPLSHPPLGIAMDPSAAPPYMLIHLRSIQSLTLHSQPPCSGGGWWGAFTIYP